ncbi:hypothetical protein [Leptolyngbya sp. 7M]|uniref:hypothetical protein n=1 Tax=Leptolyngbya sp. 7M TaxID=2812896 RepID=UPI001B8AAF1C|nr:hypothetical protein [Leptolyngbya sp. 7M]QYO62426.1 hypothetical protein JVX88_20350 [Leptolyngbya sp. 7M]
MLFILGSFISSATAQSSEQQFPTPVFENELSGEIRARSIGDPRQTTYFYTFNASQGDLFINIVTANLNADIDIFIEQGLRPLTKIMVYAGSGETETGRVIYLRKPEKLLLRIQGRTPNDDPGRFRFKFAGAFLAASRDAELPPDIPRVTDIVDVPVKVTPAGTIVERGEDGIERAERPSIGRADNTRTDQSPEGRATGSPSERPSARRRDPNDPMAGFKLVVEFRDGSVMERPMKDVNRFQVDRGVLMVLNKNGTVARYSMTDVVRVSIE